MLGVPLRKAVLTTHVTASIGWIGALAVFLVHSSAALVSRDAQVVAALSLAMSMAAWWVILPLAVAAVATGIAQSLGTWWGLTRHYWVIFKLVLACVATAVLLMKLQPIDMLALEAAKASFTGEGLMDLRKSMVLHAAGGIAVLLAAVILGIYKPAGRRGEALPRWVRACAITSALLLVAMAAMVLLGGHGR